jgi:hypothetical protein
MEYLYWKSYHELERVFKNQFQHSDAFKQMVLDLNQNMIEYKFMRQAGIIHP